jgi:hypothetical protein
VNGAFPCPSGLTDTGDGLGCLACRADADCASPNPCATNTCQVGTCSSTALCAKELCAQTVEGAFVCLAGGGTCPAHLLCATTADCSVHAAGRTCAGGRCLGFCTTDADCASIYGPTTLAVCGAGGYCVDCPAGEARIVYDVSVVPCVDGRVCQPIA